MPLQSGDLENAYFIFLIYMAIGIIGSTDTRNKKLGSSFLIYAMTLAIKMAGVRIVLLILGIDSNDTLRMVAEMLIITFMFYLVYKSFENVIGQNKAVISDSIWLLLTMISVATVGMVLVSMMVVANKVTLGMNVFVILLMGICLMSIISIFYIIEAIAKGAREENHRKELEWELEYYNDLKESQDQTRKLLHDMKNHMGAIHAMLYSQQIEEAATYLKQVSDEISEQKSIVYCKHQVANAILNNKVKKMEEAKITYEIKFDLPEEAGLNQMEIGSILANTIDNAIEACIKIEDIVKRRIEIKARYSREKVMYEIRNTKEHEVLKEGEQFVTSKADKVNHGYGLRQVKDIVGRYKGIMEVNCEGEWFEVMIII